MNTSPLNQSQLGIYMATAYNMSNAYHLATLYEFPSDFDAEALAKAVTTACSKHKMLSAAISINDDGKPEIDGSRMA